jgi:hypothetical protein
MKSCDFGSALLERLGIRHHRTSPCRDAGLGFQTDPLPEDAIARHKRGDTHIGLGFRIEYIDVFGEAHAFAFAAGYDYEAKRFKIIADDRYNEHT